MPWKASAEMCNRSVEVPKKVSRATASRGFVKVAESKKHRSSYGKCHVSSIASCIAGSHLFPVRGRNGTRTLCLPSLTTKQRYTSRSRNRPASQDKLIALTIDDDSGFSCRHFYKYRRVTTGNLLQSFHRHRFCRILL